jgi:prevent-host-death family protein
MDFRAHPGTILDRVDYRKESFLIQRAGKPKAVLIPVALYQIVQRARQRLIAANGAAQKAFRAVGVGKMSGEITKATKEVRHYAAS